MNSPMFVVAMHCGASRWKSRPAIALSNGLLELVVLSGGGHIASSRFAGRGPNLLFEAPWTTIDPQTYREEKDAAKYGQGAIGKFLSGATGHSIALGYYGPPSKAAAKAGSSSTASVSSTSAAGLSHPLASKNVVATARRFSGWISGSRASKALGKHTLYAQLDRPEVDAYTLAVEVMAAASQLPGAREGMAAFLEKRAPVWPD